MQKKTRIIIVVIGTLVLLFSVLVTTGVINIGSDAINPYVAETQINKDGVIWNFKEKVESDGLNPPQTEIELQIKDNKYLAGVYEGSCSTQNLELLLNQISGALCWWAGGGVELGVFIEDRKIVLKRRPVDEGSAEYPNFASSFETFLELE